MRVSITLLQYDHGLIRQVVDVLGEAAKQRMVEKHLEEMKEIVGFMEKFIDGFHHTKEERFVFPAALRSGSLSNADYDDLIADHNEARRLIASMRSALKAKDYASFSIDGKKMADHMLAHIREEENDIFPKIEEGLSTEEDMVINRQFETFLEENFSEDLYPATETFANWVQDNVLGPGYFEYLR
ncbi:MAG: hemerythrin domain-containing protein [Euryarchaeota archaeon]|nr:hemerythrin domain-containing protein [Euryarchaeota archaeon]